MIFALAALTAVLTAMFALALVLRTKAAPHPYVVAMRADGFTGAEIDVAMHLLATDGQAAMMGYCRQVIDRLASETGRTDWRTIDAYMM